MEQGTKLAPGVAVRLAVYWGDRLLNVVQTDEPRRLTAATVLGQGMLPAGVVPEARLFDAPLRGSSRVRLGPLVVVAEQVAPLPRLPSFGLPDDFSFFKFVIITALVAGAALVASAISGAGLDDLEGELRALPPVVTRNLVPAKTVMLKPAPTASARAARPEGEAGRRDAPGDDRPKATARAGGRALPKVGLLAALGDGATGALLAPGLSGGLEAHLHNLKNGNADLPDTKGLGALGARHSGAGGGGNDWTRIGGVGTRRGAPAAGGIPLGQGVKRQVAPAAGPTHVVGGLSKEEIARVIRRHQSEIKYCYETALQRDPSLAGKVAVMFTIDPAGAVADAALAESSLGSDTAESCMLGRVRRWKFPEPEGGGIVSVTFPWVFSAAGGDADGS